jgi:hypothetical protein
MLREGIDGLEGGLSAANESASHAEDGYEGFAEEKCLCKERRTRRYDLDLPDRK